MTKAIVLPLAATVLAACTATAPRPDKVCFHLNEASETRIGYCQAVVSGDRLYVSGSVGKGAMPDAIRMAYAELGETLKAQGLTFRDVIKENVYATDLDAFIENQDVRKEFYAGDFPAATWVQVQRLYRPAYVVEVELTARMR
jgi:2-iminobutanoate/2-iminopropanoate deaminase